MPPSKDLYDHLQLRDAKGYLGLTPNSSVSATETANAALLNSYYADYDTARKGHGVAFDPEDYFIGDPIVIPHSQGGVIQGGGVMDTPVGETHAAKNRTQCTRIIGDQLPILLDYAGAGLKIDGITFQGRYANTIEDLDDLYSTYAAKGIRIQEFDSGAMSWGPGKPTMPHVGFIGIKDCVYCGEDGVNNQADSVAIGVVRGAFIGSLLKLSSPQSVGHYVGKALLKGVQRVFDTDKGAYGVNDVTGGSIYCQFLQVDQAQNFSDPIIFKSGLMATAAPQCHIGDVNLDGALASCSLFTSGVSSAANMIVDYCRIPTQIAGAVTATLRGTNRLTVRDGYGFREQMIIGHEVSGEEPNALFLGGTMATGASHLNLGHLTTGTGDLWITVQNVVSLLGAGGPCKWTKQKYTDHVLSTTETVDSTTV